MVERHSHSFKRDIVGLGGLALGTFVTLVGTCYERTPDLEDDRCKVEATETEIQISNCVGSSVNFSCPDLLSKQIVSDGNPISKEYTEELRVECHN